jgi:hypothetical protein
VRRVIIGMMVFFTISPVFAVTVQNFEKCRNLSNKNFTQRSRTQELRNAKEMEKIFNRIWSAVKTKLAAGDIEGALHYFADGSKGEYRKIFKEMGADIDHIVSTGQIEIESIDDQVAECGVDRLENGETFSYPITFVKDRGGTWKILGF